MKLFGGFHSTRTKQGSGTRHAAASKRGTEGGERKRTPEELAEIEAMIAAYQKKKRRRRITALIVLLVLVAGGVAVWRDQVKPPDIVRPTPRPTAGATTDSAQPTSSAGLTGEGGQTGDMPEETEPPTPGPRERREDVYTFLLLGREQSYANTDTIMVGVFDAAAGSLNVVSIPRDICANVDCNPKQSETKKINSVYARSGIEGLEEALSDIMGFPIDSYISVGVNGFVALVDTIGGVNFDIPYKMNYDDPAQNLHIHFSPGEQYLGGADAIKVVRWRQNNDGTNYGDIARIQNQQNFLKAVIKKCLSWDKLLTNLDDYLAIFNEYVKTDLTTGNMAWYAKQVLKMNLENISFYTLPCIPSVNIHGFSYGMVEVEEWLTLLNERFNVYDQPMTLEDLDIVIKDENGEFTATSGTLKGGEESFLRYEDYMQNLADWNAWRRAQREKEAAEAAAAAAAAAAEAAGTETAEGQTGADAPADQPPGEQGGTEPPEDQTGADSGGEQGAGGGSEPAGEAGSAPEGEPGGGETGPENTTEAPAEGEAPDESNGGE